MANRFFIITALVALTVTFSTPLPADKAHAKDGAEDSTKASEIKDGSNGGDEIKKYDAIELKRKYSPFNNIKQAMNIDNYLGK